MCALECKEDILLLLQRKRQFLNSAFDLPVEKGLYDRLHQFDDYPKMVIILMGIFSSSLSFSELLI